MAQSLNILLDQLVDYAGMFPPAALPIDQAVANYAAYREQPEAWMLGRFVVPAGRLAEFEAAAVPLLRRGDGRPWRLSALASPELGADIGQIASFNLRHAGSMAIDTIELKAASAGEIAAARRAIPREIAAYVEIPLAAEPRPLIELLGEAGLRAKARTGGVTAGAFPAAAELADFIGACVALGVPFKATAGLHHPLRASYRLTYAPDSPSATMYGYLNVFLAAALLCAGGPAGEASAVLQESNPAAFAFDDGGATVRGHRIANEALAQARRCAVSFGSCSFREPVDDLRSLGLL
jgi:hypothetical protein